MAEALMPMKRPSDEELRRARGVIARYESWALGDPSIGVSTMEPQAKLPDAPILEPFPGGLLRPSPSREPWAKIRSTSTGKVVAGLIGAEHDDGTVSILLGGFFPVRGEVLARGVLHAFGPLTSKEEAERA